MPDTGEKPGKGQYVCQNCGQSVTLESNDAILPRCPECEETKFDLKPSDGSLWSSHNSPWAPSNLIRVANFSDPNPPAPATAPNPEKAPSPSKPEEKKTVATRHNPIAKQQYAIILVGDLEDFSTWSQSVDHSVVTELYNRFFWSIYNLLGLFGGSFIKSTGDGFIAVWSHKIGREKIHDYPQQHINQIVESVENAVLYSVLLQLLADLKFGLQWSIPRFLRCSLHSGVISHIKYRDLDRNLIEDVIGEPVNSACRVQKYGQGFLGPVITAPVATLLNASPRATFKTIETPVNPEAGAPNPADWVAGRLYGIPSVTALLDTQKQTPEAFKSLKNKDEILLFIKENAAVLFFRYFCRAEQIKKQYEIDIFKQFIPGWINSVLNNLKTLVAQPGLIGLEEMLALVKEAMWLGLVKYKNEGHLPSAIGLPAEPQRSPASSGDEDAQIKQSVDRIFNTALAFLGNQGSKPGEDERDLVG